MSILRKVALNCSLQMWLTRGHFMIHEKYVSNGFSAFVDFPPAAKKIPKVHRTGPAWFTPIERIQLGAPSNYKLSMSHA